MRSWFWKTQVVDTTAIILVTASFFTSALTASMGLGGGIFLMAIMSLFFPLSVLVPIHGVVQLASNFGRATVQRNYIMWPLIKWFIVGSVFGALLGGQLVIELPDRWLKIGLAIFIIAGVWKILPDKIISGKAGPFALGTISAFLAMFLGSTSALYASLFSRLPEKRQIVGTHSAASTIQHALKIAIFGFLGFSFADYWALILAMVITGFLGTLVGSKLLNKLPEKQFRIVFVAGLTLLALDMLRRALMNV